MAGKEHSQGWGRGSEGTLALALALGETSRLGWWDKGTWEGCGTVGIPGEVLGILGGSLEGVERKVLVVETES